MEAEDRLVAVAASLITLPVVETGRCGLSMACGVRRWGRGMSPYVEHDGSPSGLECEVFVPPRTSQRRNILMSRIDSCNFGIT